MDIFEYFDFFKNNESTNNLADVEEKIIDSLFEKYIPSTGRILVVSSDNIHYAFKLAEQGYKVTVTEFSDEKIAEIKNDEKFSLLEGIVNTSPLNLSMFDEDSFDIVISLGIMCRLQTRAEREAFTREATRVLIAGGNLAYTYMTPMAMTFGQYFNAYKALDSDSKLKAYRGLAAVEKTHSFGDYYGLNLDEMADISREYGLDIQTVASTYCMVNDFSGEIASLNEEYYTKFVEEQIAICEDPFLTRYCMRGLFIGKKKVLDLFD
ncbi:MAG: class I SAM-dependent methyltransferase [Clostridia bacterium]|nr:class I SAM-dependent methyltransferase [Clostridia bacterium]MBQ4096610.1 class I SAM-dependent methyltransferase [Clostridia bacterium]